MLNHLFGFFSWLLFCSQYHLSTTTFLSSLFQTTLFFFLSSKFLPLPSSPQFFSKLYHMWVPFSFSSTQINKCSFYIKSAQLNFVDLHKIQHMIQRRRQSSTTSFYPFFLINCWLYKLKFKTLMFIFVCNFVCEYCCWIAFIFSIIILFFSFSTQILDVWSYFFF